MVRKVCLSKDRHAVSILRNLRHMKSDEDLCDFIIKVKGIAFRVHKCVVSASSPYFKAMLKYNTKENQEGMVELMDVDAECVESCIDFMYSSNFDIPDGKIAQLLYVAIMMQLDDVKDAICNILNIELNAGNFHETRAIANLYDLPSLSRKCITYYEENFMEIIAQPGFKYEEKSHIVSILKSEILKVSEEDKLTACLLWVGETLHRRGSLAKMIKSINLTKVPALYLRDLVKNNPLISDNFMLYKLLTAPLLEIAAGKPVVNTDDEKTVPLLNEMDDQLSEYDENVLVLFDGLNDCLQFYNPVTKDVSKLHNESVGCFGSFVAICIDSYIYVLCGDRSVYGLYVQDEYSEWERMQDMILDHGILPPAVAHSGSLFVMASYNEATNDIEMFDPVATRWMRLSGKPKVVSTPTLVSLNSSIYCIGGWDKEDKPMDSFCRFKPLTSEWIELEPMRDAATICGAVAVNRQIIVISGLGEWTECYDVNLGQWTSLSPVYKDVEFSTAHHIDGWIYLVPRWKNLREIDVYDIANDEWSQVIFEDTDCFEIIRSLTVRM